MGPDRMIRPIQRLLCVVIVRNRNHSAKRKDVTGTGTCLNRAGIEVGIGATGSIDSQLVRVHKETGSASREGKDFHPKFTLCRA